MAQKLAQAMVDSYKTLGSQNQSTDKAKTSQLLETESATVKEKLQNAEQSLDTYKDLLDFKARIDAQQATSTDSRNATARSTRR